MSELRQWEKPCHGFKIMIFMKTDPRAMSFAKSAVSAFYIENIFFFWNGILAFIFCVLLLEFLKYFIHL